MYKYPKIPNSGMKKSDMIQSWSAFYNIAPTFSVIYPLNTGHKLNLHKTFRKHSGGILKVFQFMSCVQER